MPLKTERLTLRRWRDEDREPFAALNADPEVMEFYASTLTREESDGLAQRIDAPFDDKGISFWAVEVQGGAAFIGFVGLNIPIDDTLPFMPAVEVGWRLAREHWGHGYATEAGRASLDYGFNELGRREIMAWAVTTNDRSRRVMERIGMTYDPSSDFDYHAFPVGHPLGREVVYRASAPHHVAGPVAFGEAVVRHAVVPGTAAGVRAGRSGVTRAGDRA